MKADTPLREIAQSVQSFVEGKKAQKIKLLILGQNTNDGWLAKIVIYYLLSIVAFLYLQPFFYMVTTMLKSLGDLLDPTVQWIPRTLDWSNLERAFKGLKYPEAVLNTSTIALFGSLIQVLICGMTGYALARLKFPGKKLIFGLVFLTFLIPPQIIIIPLYVIFSKLGWLNTPFVFLVPALFGQGLKSALFIIIFRQFFNSLPKALEEAAMIDGASVFRLFFRIIFPLSLPACLVVFLFSFVWYWNEFYMTSFFLSTDFTPLSLRLGSLETVIFGPNPVPEAQMNNPVTEGTKMAGAFLIVFPPLLLYMIAQRWFVEGIERTGLID
ncbi:carbohydrate ABC transporter permease [Paenibacillus qinlingensis]|uniref:Multiple sugar transport system permease protein n=1 Tax=Paenibacillus qinlingensis TaxID=1837343 RepID=A0ABU1NNY7_9BACL|nr:carbohydrate ABC transporter permease [Paenibacillus qinlingensis]MDR6549118.1 multiple sugar transport system permease protein [Paenibacillus qinlingensis]